MSFADEISSTQVQQLTELSQNILKLYIEYTKKHNLKQDIYCKLHNLSHYGQLVEQFGPLRYFKTFHYEQKHQFAKFVARQMRCFKNTSKTIHEKHQLSRALVMQNSNFLETNFWIQNQNATVQLLPELPDELSNYTKMKASDHPYQLCKNILRKINQTNNWFYSLEFYQRNSDIYCVGKVLTLHPNQIENSLPLLIEDVSIQYVLFENLHYSNNFLFKKDDKLYLLEWI